MTLDTLLSGLLAMFALGIAGLSFIIVKLLELSKRQSDQYFQFHQELVQGLEKANTRLNTHADQLAQNYVTLSRIEKTITGLDKIAETLVAMTTSQDDRK